MSDTIQKTVACPVCGGDNEITVYKTINAASDPELREKLLNGELLHFRCEHCGHEATLEYPLLYNGMRDGFMVYYIPAVDREKITDEALEKEYADIEGVTRRLVGSFNELKEKIHIFESGLDDKVIEVVKAALKDVVEKRTEETVLGGYFSKYSASEEKIGFTFFVGEQEEQFVQTTRLEIYRRSMDVAASIQSDPADRSFVCIDRGWARNAIYSYRKRK